MTLLISGDRSVVITGSMNASISSRVSPVSRGPGAHWPGRSSVRTFAEDERFAEAFAAWRHRPGKVTLGGRPVQSRALPPGGGDPSSGGRSSPGQPDVIAGDPDVESVAALRRALALGPLAAARPHAG